MQALESAYRHHFEIWKNSLKALQKLFRTPFGSPWEPFESSLETLSKPFQNPLEALQKPSFKKPFESSLKTFINPLETGFAEI